MDIMTAQPVLSWGACTDKGRVRPDNQDAFLADQTVFVVADGMGGHSNGSLAARFAVESMSPLVGIPAVTAAEVRDCLVAANDRISAIDPASRAPAGTTFTGAFATAQHGEPHWLIVNVGDSRTYLLRDGEFTQVTVDHSEVQELMDAGLITAAEAVDHPRRNIITRALGLGGSSRADLWMLPMAPGDRVLVCSDGVTKELPDAQLQQFLAAPDSAEVIAEGVVSAALVAGGNDNATAVVVTVAG